MNSIEEAPSNATLVPLHDTSGFEQPPPGHAQSDQPPSLAADWSNLRALER